MITVTLRDGSKSALPNADTLSQSNCGTAGVWRFDSGVAGPRVAITALVHGNEICGAHAAWRVIESAPKPARGCLTIVCCNLEAYRKLDDTNKDECRFVDEDLNRVWGRVEEAGATYEMRRAREILPFVQDADVLLDLHSMSEIAPPLGLVGVAAKNVAFARRIGYPLLLVRDKGHAAGLRLIDRDPFVNPDAAPVAMLVECGQHFSRSALNAADEVVRRTIAVCLEDAEVAPAGEQSLVEVTEAVTIESGTFAFEGEWPNMGVVPQAGTLVARDGEREVRTPYADTYMIMPATARYRRPGLTAVRFGKKVALPSA